MAQDSSFLANCFFESVLFLTVLGIMLYTFSKKRHTSNRTQKIVFWFIFFYMLSIGFSAATKYLKYLDFLQIPEFVQWEENYWFNLLYQARLKYVVIVISHYNLNRLYHEVFSKPRQWYSKITENLTSVVITLHFMPIFTSIFKLFLMGTVFVHALVVFVPIWYSSYKMLSKTSKETHSMMKNTFTLSILLMCLLFFGLIDAVINNIVNRSFPLFYYLSWIMLFFILIKSARDFIFHHKEAVILDNNFLHDGNQEKPSHSMFIECPICHSASYYPISESISKKAQQNPSGITSMLIPAMTVCEHAFIVHFDLDFKVRNTQEVDFVA